MLAAHARVACSQGTLAPSKLTVAAPRRDPRCRRSAEAGPGAQEQSVGGLDALASLTSLQHLALCVSLPVWRGASAWRRAGWHAALQRRQPAQGTAFVGDGLQPAGWQQEPAAALPQVLSLPETPSPPQTACKREPRRHRRAGHRRAPALAAAVGGQRARAV
jgi:hypothetical protein